MNNTLDKFEIQPYWTTDFGVFKAAMSLSKDLEWLSCERSLSFALLVFLIANIVKAC